MTIYFKLGYRNLTNYVNRNYMVIILGNNLRFINIWMDPLPLICLSALINNPFFFNL
jgi:hypothetical protein